ncbi:Dot/Icm T4SS effector Ceg32/SidI [Legionella sainthelensi]|uniref:Dot/Icm T4SS effector Ceg32/SidI n=1 Tax=Legionella sainthelensi TaxID=28087 RepID=UPI000E1FF788|nr:Dot/Icm T4SS effector Ceg32/SidI [Legionella sainthelensi]
MPKIYLLTAPFDEDAKTGDGQYAASLELGFAENYDISCTWLKKDLKHYSIPFPSDTTSIPADTIPSAIVLQPVANENTIISGYKLKEALSSIEEAQEVNIKTVSPRTPKVLVKHDNSLQSLTIMDIYSQKPIQLDEINVDKIINSLKTKKTKLEKAIEDNNDELSKIKKPKSKLARLIKLYNENKENIKDHCSLNEYIEAHLIPKDFSTRHKKALDNFLSLKEHFAGPVNLKALEKLTDKFTGIKDYTYDFHSNNLPYDLERDKKFRNFYGFDEFKGSIKGIITELEELSRIRLAVSERYDHSFKAINEGNEDLQSKLAFIKLILNDGFKEVYDQEKFIKALLNPVEDAIRSYTNVKNKLENIQDIFANNNGYRDNLILELQNLISNQQEPYLSANKMLSGFYGKRILSASEGFHLAYQANRRDPIKPEVIKSMIASMQPIEEDTHLDIHIRPPDCGVFITPEDIKKFQEAKIKVNITIHEYKQNYTRRYLQQYTHDLMRQADSVQFFNESDRDNAIIAATYGDCDKRNTNESTGVAKKIREVGEDYTLNKYPVKKYDLKGKSGLTVASQKLSTTPDHPLDVVAKKPNILSFGTIRPGKGFEEALKLAQLVKQNASSIEKKIPQIPIVKLAGDPQDKELMQQIVEERFGSVAVETYQITQAYDSKFTNSQRRDYWKNLVNELNRQVKEDGATLNNPYIEIHPWCEAHELLKLKQSCKYVCRMDDMGMRNNGSAIISVLDVGVVYTKFGSVTDDVFIKGGKYGNAVDIGEYRYGKFSLLKKEKDFIKEHDKEPLPKWLIKNPDSAYKRQPESRDPQDILNSIVAREENQLACRENIKNSENYKTIVEAQKLLTERFTLKNAVDHLLENVGLQDLIIKEKVDDLFETEEPLLAQTNNLEELATILPERFYLSKSCPELGFFGSRRSKLEIEEENNKLKKSIIVF